MKTKTYIILTDRWSTIDEFETGRGCKMACLHILLEFTAIANYLRTLQRESEFSSPNPRFGKFVCCVKKAPFSRKVKRERLITEAYAHTERTRASWYSRISFAPSSPATASSQVNQLSIMYVYVLAINFHVHDIYMGVLYIYIYVTNIYIYIIYIIL